MTIIQTTYKYSINMKNLFNNFNNKYIYWHLSILLI